MKIYPSSYSHPAGHTIDASYHQSCPRYYTFKDELGIGRSDIPAIYAGIGEIGELAVLERLTLRFKDLKLEREQPFKYDLGNGYLISGRVDFIQDIQGKFIIHEAKSSFSRTIYSQCIRQGRVMPSHLGQIVTYLASLSSTYGILHIQYFHFNREATSLDIEVREFHIKLVDEDIYIDGEKYFLNAYEILKFYKIMRDSHMNSELPPEPTTKNPCLNCPFNQVCIKNPKSKDEFSRIYKSLEVASVDEEPREIRIQRHNIKEI